MAGHKISQFIVCREYENGQETGLELQVCYCSDRDDCSESFLVYIVAQEYFPAGALRQARVG